MTARLVMWAPGGGFGHATRAVALAARLGARALVLHQAPEPVEAPAGVRLRRIPAGWDPARAARALARLARAADALVVDTFPAGVAGEVTDEVLRAARRRVLVKRHVRRASYPDHDALAARFDEELLPYPAGGCEWDGEARGVHVGHLLRDLPLAPGPEAALCVLGDAARLPAAWRARLAGARHVRGRVAALPPARRYLSVGAGYHATYELARLGRPHGLVPLERRWDDQFRRAGRAARAVLTRADLDALLAGEGPWS